MSDFEEDRKTSILDAYGPGKVTMKECQRCGYLVWRSTAPKETNDVVFQPYDTFDQNDCPLCQNIAQRNPELFDWVLRVFAKHGT